MGLGLGILLLVIGAILSFAVNDGVVAGINLTTIGYILMAAGLVTAIVSALMMNRSRTVVARRTTTVGDPRDPYAV